MAQHYFETFTLTCTEKISQERDSITVGPTTAAFVTTTNVTLYLCSTKLWELSYECSVVVSTKMKTHDSSISDVSSNMPDIQDSGMSDFPFGSLNRPRLTAICQICKMWGTISTFEHTCERRTKRLYKYLGFHSGVDKHLLFGSKSHRPAVNTTTLFPLTLD